MSGVRRVGTNDWYQKVPKKFRRRGQIADLEFEVWTLDLVKVGGERMGDIQAFSKRAKNVRKG